MAEELGVKAWLALEHTYLKVHNKEQGWYNVELTSGTFPTDAFIIKSMGITLET